MPGEIAGALGGVKVPEAQGLVLARGDQLCAVRANADRRDFLAVAAQRAQRLPAGNVPQPDGAIVTPGDKQAAVLAIREASHRLGVSFQDLRLVAVHVVDLDQVIRATDGEAAARRIEGDLVQAGLPRRNGAHRRAARVRLPDAHHAVVAGRGNPLAVGAVGDRADDKSPDRVLEPQLAGAKSFDWRDRHFSKTGVCCRADRNSARARNGSHTRTACSSRNRYGRRQIHCRQFARRISTARCPLKAAKREKRVVESINRFEFPLVDRDGRHDA